MSCVVVVFSNGVLPSLCGKQLIVFAVWGYPQGTFGQQLNNFNPFPEVEVSFGDERCVVGSLSSSFFSDSV